LKRLPVLAGSLFFCSTRGALNMRAFILVAGAVLSLAACGRSNEAGQVQNADESLSAESIVSNDVTAIDAATGDAANMAADVDLNYGNLLENGAGTTLNAPTKAAVPRASRQTAPAAETVTNAAETNAE
jgi:hypothetical protein